MILQDLLMGTDIYLEIVHGERKFEIPSKIMGIDKGGVFIPIFSVGGNTIDFSTIEFSGIVFNLYCIDKRYDNRYCWKSVSLHVTKWQGEDYYLVSSTGFGKIGKESDRRNNERLILNLLGEAILPQNRESIQGAILNISNDGIAFCTQKNFMEIGSRIKICFQDNVGEHHFSLNIEVRCVRKEPFGQNYFYGCNLTEQSKQWLTYVFLKKLRKKVPDQQDNAEINTTDT